MRVLVCGGRTYSNYARVCRILNDIHAVRPIEIVVHGAAKGADTLANMWARYHKIAIWDFPADWENYGKAAGAVRNQQMLTDGQPDIVVAFPGGTGTADMVRRATKSGVEVIIVDPETV